MSRVRSSVRLALWTAALVVAARLLLAAGSPSLSVPLTSADAFADWVATAPPADMAMAILRLAALAANLYLLAVTALCVAARAVRVGRLASAVEAVTPEVVRRLVAGGSGVGLAIGAAAASLPVPDVDDHLPGFTIASEAGAAVDPSATMTRVAEAAAAARAAPAAHAAKVQATMTLADEPAPATATMTRQTAAVTGAAAPSPTPAAPPPALPSIDAGVWVVEPGDSFWSIAEDVVGGASRDAQVDERAVARYWRRLVDANRSDLVDPSNADLLVTGQRLVVPPPA
jgi:hypothetical protein